jgi:hypothetical protein
MLIHVTQEDIDQGRAGDSHECPIALAIRRETGGKEPDVHDTIFMLKGWQAYKSLPDEAMRFIELFDCAGPKHVQPITLDLPI